MSTNVETSHYCYGCSFVDLSFSHFALMQSNQKSRLRVLHSSALARKAKKSELGFALNNGFFLTPFFTALPAHHPRSGGQLLRLLVVLITYTCI